MEQLFITELLKKAKIINKQDIFLCDSGGQYKYGTTDELEQFVFLNLKKNKRYFHKSFKRSYRCSKC